MKNLLLENQLNRDVISLLAICNIPPMEKRVWLNTLEYMTDDEKKEVIENLQKEAKYEEENAAASAANFIAALENGNAV